MTFRLKAILLTLDFLNDPAGGANAAFTGIIQSSIKCLEPVCIQGLAERPKRVVRYVFAKLQVLRSRITSEKMPGHFRLRDPQRHKEPLRR